MAHACGVSVEGEIGCLGSLEKLSACFVKTKYIDVGNPKGYKYAQSIFNQ